MSVHVFVVGSPLQLLNALEAQWVFEAPHRVLVVVATRHMIEQIEPMIKAEDWAAVDRIALDAPRSRLGRRVSEIAGVAHARRGLDRLARTWSDVDHLFLGNLNPAYARHLANTVPHKTLVVLDDGTATIGIAHRRHEAVGRERSRWAAVRIGLRERLMGVRGREPDRLVFFTSYDVEVGPNDMYVRNGFVRLREQMARVGVGAEVLFLGQPLVETNEMLADVYLAYVRAARDHLGSTAFVYAPHRHEAPDRVERLRVELGVPVRWSDVPIEVALIRSGCLPRVLASFHSSALDNCRLIFGDVGMQIRALEIASEHLECHQAFVGRVYAYLRAQRGTAFDVDALLRPVATKVGTVPASGGPAPIRWTESKRSEASRSWSAAASSFPATPST